MKIMVILFEIGALGTVSKGLVKELKDLKRSGRVETIQTTTTLRSARILRRVLETWRDLLSLKLQWKTINFQMSKISNEQNKELSWPCQRTKKKQTMEHDGDTSCKWCTWNYPQRIGKVPEDLEIREQVETIQTTGLFWSARILRRVLETWGDSPPLKLQWYTN